jgi:protoporphyrinogen oxidase
LSTACALLARGGYDVEVYEKDDGQGGIAGSTEFAGFALDYGPHRFQTRRSETLSFVTGLIGCKLNRQRKKIGVQLGGTIVDYPPRSLQSLGLLGLRETARTGTSYLSWRLRSLFLSEPSSYADQLARSVGRRAAETLFAPMSRKLWGREMNELSADLARHRVILSGPLSRRRYIDHFYYPDRCIGQLWSEAASAVGRLGGTVHKGTRVSKIEVRADGGIDLHVDGQSDAKVCEAQCAVSTIPLEELLTLINPACDRQAIEAANQLRYRSVVFVYFLLDKPRVSPYHFIYFPEPEYAFHRVYEQKNFAQEACPGGRTVLCAELGCDLGDARWRMSAGELRDLCVPGLEAAGLIKPAEVLDVYCARQERAYPLLTLDYSENLRRAVAAVDKVPNVLTNGRQGLFRFNNMDHAIEMGVAAAETIAAGDMNRWPERRKAFERFQVID